MMPSPRTLTMSALCALLAACSGANPWFEPRLTSGLPSAAEGGDVVDRTLLVGFGTVHVLRGTVAITGEDGSARSGAGELMNGDLLTTGPADQVEIRFSDGSVVTVKPNTKVQVEQKSLATPTPEGKSLGRRLDLIDGGVEVSTEPNPYVQTTVRGADADAADDEVSAIIETKGTKYSADRNQGGGSLRVSMQEGVARIYHPTVQVSFTVAPGQVMSFTMDIATGQVEVSMAGSAVAQALGEVGNQVVQLDREARLQAVREEQAAKAAEREFEKAAQFNAKAQQALAKAQAAPTPQARANLEEQARKFEQKAAESENKGNGHATRANADPATTPSQKAEAAASRDHNDAAKANLRATRDPSPQNQQAAEQADKKAEASEETAKQEIEKDSKSTPAQKEAKLAKYEARQAQRAQNQAEREHGNQKSTASGERVEKARKETHDKDRQAKAKGRESGSDDKIKARAVGGKMAVKNEQTGGFEDKDELETDADDNAYADGFDEGGADWGDISDIPWILVMLEILQVDRLDFDVYDLVVQLATEVGPSSIITLDMVLGFLDDIHDDWHDDFDSDSFFASSSFYTEAHDHFHESLDRANALARAALGGGKTDAHEFTHLLGEYIHLFAHARGGGGFDDLCRDPAATFSCPGGVDEEFTIPHNRFHTIADALHADFHNLSTHDFLHKIYDLAHDNFHKDLDLSDPFDVEDHNFFHQELDLIHNKIHELGFHGAIHFFLDDLHTDWHEHHSESDPDFAEDHADFHRIMDITHDQMHIIFGIPR